MDPHFEQYYWKAHKLLGHQSAISLLFLDRMGFAHLRTKAPIQTETETSVRRH
jgi:hypothetical protein